ncbi:MAG TPA: preprotein translocase subunit SecE [Thermoleophilaceae bacterium]|nr:preprotein translocase subunit SecE [Thermoleophilaceae bacterium]
MARDRQRAKQRQAQRREERAAARREGRDELDEKAGPLSGISGAPPENTGRSDTVAESSPPAPLLDNQDHLRDEDPELDDVDPELEADALEAGALGEGEGQVYEDELEPVDAGRGRAAGGPRGVRGGRSDPAQPVSQSSGSKVLNFLKACWAELQRVQWPDRRTLTQLTGIVLFFCVLAGGYLGLLDAIFSKIIQAIL